MDADSAAFNSDYNNLNHPAQLDRHLGDIEILQDGKLILASSNLTGRYWTSSLWCFPNPDNVTPESSLAGTVIPTGIGCLSVLRSSTEVCLGLDHGGITVVGLTENSIWQLHTLAEAIEHDECVTALDSAREKNEIVSGSMDRMIKIWDAETLVSSSTFRNAHSDSIAEVRYSPEDSNIFASCSVNGEVSMWDPRLSKPAKDLAVTNMYGLPCSLAWGNDGSIAIGTETGHFLLLDPKNPAEPKSAIQTHNRRICKIKPYRNTFAISADDSRVIAVKASSTGECVVSYQEDQHSDFVRGLAWNPLTSHLYSSSWDKRVLRHEVPL